MWYYSPNAHPIIQHTTLQYHIVCGGGGAHHASTQPKCHSIMEILQKKLNVWNDKRVRIYIKASHIMPKYWYL